MQTSISLLVLSCALAGCAGAQPQSDTRSGGNASAIVIRSNEISGTALQSIRTRIPSVRISTDGGCPRITFRGNLSVNNQRDPTVYIDGTLMSDTCALTTMTANEIDRIEIYPSGDTPEATIQRNPSGVIIVYRRRE